MAADRASDAIAAHTISRRDIRTPLLPHPKSTKGWAEFRPLTFFKGTQLSG